MTRDKLIKKIATWIMMAIMLSVFSLDIICVAMCNKYQNKFEITPAQFSSDGTADRIHFLNTYNSDAILIESNGKFALIDSGEGDRNPRRKLSYNGSEEAVIKYLKKAAVEPTMGIAAVVHRHHRLADAAHVLHPHATHFQLGLGPVEGHVHRHRYTPIHRQA